MNVGISVAKDLAVIVGIDSLDGPGERLVRMFTPADGRAFRAVAYFKHWVSEKQIETHDADAELDFARTVLDFCRDSRSKCRVGYSAEQVKLAQSSFPQIELVPVPKDRQHNALLMDFLNTQARQWGGYLYPMGHVMQFMWTSLPMDEKGDRCLPTPLRTADGRWDGIRALLNCLSVSGLIEQQQEQAEAQAEQREQSAFLQTLFRHEWIWVQHSFAGQVKRRPHEAVNMIANQGAKFLCIGKSEETECPKTNCL